MSRVLITGATATIGIAIVRRLLSDPSYEVRVADLRATPQWMREGCEIHTGDLRDPDLAHKATRGCTHVIHLAGATDIALNPRRLPHTTIEINRAIDGSLTRAALDLEVERFTYVSSSSVFEHASEFPTTEAHLPDCPAPSSTHGFSMLIGEVCCRAAQEEHGLPFTICRPFGAYGPEGTLNAEPESTDLVFDLIMRALSGARALEIPGSGQQSRTLTHVEDVAEGIVAAISSPSALNEDFNISAPKELTVTEIAQMVWQACGKDAETFALERLDHTPLDARRCWPSVAKARELLGWEAKTPPPQGIAATVERLEGLRARGFELPISSRPT